MKVQIITVALAVAALPMLGQSSLSGVSRPDETDISASPDAPVLTPRPQAAKPAAGTPAVAPTNAVVYGPYVPYTGPTAAGAEPANAVNAATDADDDMPNDATDGQIVLTVPDIPGQLGEGTLLQTKVLESLSTASTVPGTPFRAEVMAPVEKDGRVIIPIGAILEGQVTEVHQGHRITGAAALHLETRDVVLPDGTHYVVHAQLIDTSRSEFKVNDEGTLKRIDHAKENLAVVSLAAGGGAAAGAMIGGPGGALVGAGVGAGVSTVMWLKQDRQATLAKDVRLTFSLTTPMMLTPLSNGTASTVSMNGAAAAGVAQ